MLFIKGKGIKEGLGSILKDSRVLNERVGGRKLTRLSQEKVMQSAGGKVGGGHKDNWPNFSAKIHGKTKSKNDKTRKIYGKDKCLLTLFPYKNNQ